ncbi:MAG: putative bifunctional diguanylate cyclase/phosphodiesterase [Trueperaceae bacterium]
MPAWTDDEREGTRGAALRRAVLALTQAVLAAPEGAGGPYRRLLEEAVRHVPGAQAGAMLERDADGSHRLVATWGVDPGFLLPDALDANALPAGTTVAVLRGADAPGLGRSGPPGALAGRHAGAWNPACLVVPVAVGDEPAGHLLLYACDAADGFPREAIDLGAVLGPLTGTLMQRLRLEAELRAERDKLDHLAHHDPLTGLPNRALLMDRLRQALARDARDGRLTGLLLLDLDGFQRVNDRHGHEVGDLLLARLSDRLRERMRDVDTVAHLGGDEFALVASGVERLDEVRVLAQQALAASRAVFDLGAVDVHVGGSIGVAIAPHDAEHAEGLLQNATLAMQRAKLRGRGEVTFYTASVDATMRERGRLTDDLRDALLSDRHVWVAFQPKVDLTTGACVGAEALARWDHPDRGPVSPDLFAPLTEEAGMVHTLSARVYDEACAAFAAWKARGLTAGWRLALNVQPQQLSQGDVVALVHAVLRRHGLDTRDLELEVTESIAFGDAEDALEPLRVLRDEGARVAIDDFGKGFSSLQRLATLPIDTLKIDRSFVRAMGGSGRGAAVVDTIAALAHAFGLGLVAEGVETPAQADALRQRGCGVAQGFLYSRPLRAADLPAWLEAHERRRRSASASRGA